MFECFIWLMASDRRYAHWDPLGDFADDDEPYKSFYRRVVKKVEAACKVTGIEFENLHFAETYGGVAVSAGFMRNHPAGAPQRQRAFLEELATSAPATYGVIYMLDSDREHVRPEFTVLKLANGVVTESLDLLAPDRLKHA